jgi:uncharacterized protein
VKIVNEIRKRVKRACFAKSNFFGVSSWGHIEEVAYFSKLLAKKLGADVEICVLSAWLHDYAAVSKKKWYKEHHVHGKRLAGELLKELNYPKERIEQVQHCIYAHRGSRNIKRKTICRNSQIILAGLS